MVVTSSPWHLNPEFSWGGDCLGIKVPTKAESRSFKGLGTEDQALKRKRPNKLFIGQHFAPLRALASSQPLYPTLVIRLLYIPWTRDIALERVTRDGIFTPKH
eukprot:1153148-Pelagomonas_calceolata.AAC.2